MNADELIELFIQHSDEATAEKMTRFFKMGKGSYGENDEFMGISMPTNRSLVKDFTTMALEEVSQLFQSRIHEIRMAGVLILVGKFKKKKLFDQQVIFDFYLDHLEYVNNWDLVDTSATAILGAYLYNKPKDTLHQLTMSSNLWERRVAAVATLFYVRKREFEVAIEICEALADDTEDMVQKATGWVLRECIKKDSENLNYLRSNLQLYPRKVVSIAIQDQNVAIKSSIREEYKNAQMSKKYSL